MPPALDTGQRSALPCNSRQRALNYVKPMPRSCCKVIEKSEIDASHRPSPPRRAGRINFFDFGVASAQTILAVPADLTAVRRALRRCLAVGTRAPGRFCHASVDAGSGPKLRLDQREMSEASTPSLDAIGNDSSAAFVRLARPAAGVAFLGERCTGGNHEQPRFNTVRVRHVRVLYDGQKVHRPVYVARRTSFAPNRTA